LEDTLSEIRIYARNCLSTKWYRYCTICRNFSCNSSTNYLSIWRDLYL